MREIEENKERKWRERRERTQEKSRGEQKQRQRDRREYNTKGLLHTNKTFLNDENITKGQRDFVLLYTHVHTFIYSFPRFTGTDES